MVAQCRGLYGFVLTSLHAVVSSHIGEEGTGLLSFGAFFFVSGAIFFSMDAAFMDSLFDDPSNLFDLSFADTDANVRLVYESKETTNPIKGKGTWSEKEDALLTSLIGVHGPAKWTFLSSHIDGRNGKQVRTCISSNFP